MAFLQMQALGLNYARQGVVTSFLASMCLFGVVLVVLFRAGHLIVSCFMTTQGYMLDLLGDMSFTVSSSQLSGVCVTKQTVCMICMLHISLFAHMAV